MSIEHRRPTGVVGDNPNVKPVGAAWGEPYGGTANVQHSSTSSSVQPAGLYSTAPYVDPSTQVKPKPPRAPYKAETQPRSRTQCKAKGGTCKGFASPETGLCGGHAKSLSMGRSID